MLGWTSSFWLSRGPRNKNACRRSVPCWWWAPRTEVSFSHELWRDIMKAENFQFRHVRLRKPMNDLTILGCVNQNSSKIIQILCFFFPFSPFMFCMCSVLCFFLNHQNLSGRLKTHQPPHGASSLANLARSRIDLAGDLRTKCWLFCGKKNRTSPLKMFFC